ncbi:MAG: carboxymuconolactone decarboxylase family protein [Deltaproteobacteria bacterium]|nr:carboxymuconolactone decarboxylase family protein [Deltaproteobacteria bacterium]
MARLTYPSEAAASAEFQSTYKQIRERGGKVLNLFKIMSYSPEVGRQFLQLGNAILFKGVVPKTLRELAILRVGNLYSASYEWTQHVTIALRVGVRQSQIDALPYWLNSPEFDDQEKAVLRYTDEVTLQIRVTDEAFAAARSFLNEEAIVELTTAISYYGMVCRILETLQVELEQE